MAFDGLYYGKTCHLFARTFLSRSTVLSRRWNIPVLRASCIAVNVTHYANACRCVFTINVNNITACERIKKRKMFANGKVATL